MSIYYNIRNPSKNFFKFSPYFMYLRHSQTATMDATAVFFIECADLQFHYNSMFDSLYITGTCHFYLCFFAHRDFVVPIFHPLFDPTVPYIAITLQVAHLAPPTAPAPAAPASPPQVVPSLSLDDDEDPSEASALSHDSSFGPSDSYTLAEPGIANRFLSSASDWRP